MEKGGNFFTRWGQFYEDTAVAVFEKVMRIPVGKSNYWQHPKYEWLYATPDGLIDDQTILEIKNPWKQCHDTVTPPYMAQMQTQMPCAERTKAFFMSQCIRTDKAKIWNVNYSISYYNWMMPQLEHWHNSACGIINLDLSKFNRTPPHVDYELVCEVPSLKAVLGSIPVSDELFTSASCKWGSVPVLKSESAKARGLASSTRPNIPRFGVIPKGVEYDWSGSGTKNKRKIPERSSNRISKVAKVRDLFPTKFQGF